MDGDNIVFFVIGISSWWIPQQMARLPVEACHGAQGDRVGTSGQILLGTGPGYIPMSSPVVKMVEPLFFSNFSISLVLDKS